MGSNSLFVFRKGSNDVRAQDPAYSVPPQPWNVNFGNHRARVLAEAATDAVRVHIDWRRRDHDAARKQILVVDAATGRDVDNVVRVEVNREFGDLIFQPVTTPGEYHVYYLPYLVPENGGYIDDYLPEQSKADAAWIYANGLSEDDLKQGAWRKLPAAQVVDIQARTEFSRFDPMEVVATVQEVADLRATHTGTPYLVFPEDRRRPIRMTADLPLSWIRKGPALAFRGDACRNEWYAFQIGLYAMEQALDGIAVDFTDLRGPGGAAIPATALRCINTGGMNWDGRPLRNDVSVPQGKVQALWCGVQVPRDAAPGEYAGTGDGELVQRPGVAGGAAAERVAGDS